MLTAFLYTLRTLKIPVGTQEWLYLMDALSQDLANSSLNQFYYLARAVLIKSEANYDAFDEAFIACFRDPTNQINIQEEVLDWLNRLVTRERPPIPDVDPLSLKELIEKFKQRLAEQKEEHHGGNHWIGTGGTSPFGHSGSHPSGIRLGGPGGGRMAMQVAEERRFKTYRQDRTLDIRQFKVALKRLRRLDRLGMQEEINLEKSIAATCKNAGEIELIIEAPKKNQAELLLLMDVGGSMDPYVALMEQIFSAAHASNHFKAFEHFYFHNCIYHKVYTDIFQRQSIATEELFRKFRSTFYVIVVGDASMNPYELFAPNGSIDYWENHRDPGITWLRRIQDHFPKIVWLNPEAKMYWNYYPTIRAIAQEIPMFPLTVAGLTEAVDALRSKR